MAGSDQAEHPGELSRSDTGAGTRPRPQGREAGAFIPSEVDLPKPLRRLFLKYPCLKRHPHPFIVHFPIVFTYAAAFFSLVYLWTGVSSFDTTAFHCLGAAILTMPPAMVSGELSRRLNYPREPDRAFAIERRYSWLLLVFGGAAFVWRGLDPSILATRRGASLVYLAPVLSLPVLVTIISYFGGLLTFPLDKGRK